MNLEKIRFKKSLKLITLLLTSLLIAGASAATYYGMNIIGTITMKNAQVIWVAGTNKNATLSIVGSTATVGLSAMNGTNQIFNDTLYLKNLNSTRVFTVNFTTTQALSTTYFTTAKMLIYNNASFGTLLGSLDLTKTTSPVIELSLNGGEVYSLVFNITATTSASGSNNFGVEATYK
jgi:hypothetical protein